LKILLVSATHKEILPLVNKFKIDNQTSFFQCLNLGIEDVDILITGVGVPNTILKLTKHLSENSSYNICINLGICGAFDRKVPLGSVFWVTRDRFGDLGVEDADGTFRDVFDIQIAEENFSYHTDGTVKNNSLIHSEIQYPQANSVTVNKVTGSDKSIHQIYDKYHPDIETMEGAGVFLVCNEFNVPCIQLRAVSNYVEPRNKSNWDIPIAISNVNQAAIDLLQRINRANFSFL